MTSSSKEPAAGRPSGSGPAADAAAFSLSFEWGDIPLCTTGHPGRVHNPVFTLDGIPAGTVAFRFVMTDLDAPRFNHGGGTVRHDGGAVVAPGAFDYLQPCPPHGRHTYQWTVEALDGHGRTIATAKATRLYP